MDPLEIFPEPVWETIFEHLKDVPQNWLNLYHVSPSFESVVGEQRKFVLFPKVFCHAAKYLNRNDLLALRLVSKKWNNTVDLGLELSEDNPLGECYNFKDTTSISAFWTKFESHPKNPFIGRTVRCFDFKPSTQDMVAYRAMVSNVISTFGKHIRKFRVTDFIGDIPTASSVSCVTETPTLEALEVLCVQNCFDAMEVQARGHPDEALVPTLKSFSFHGIGARRLLVSFQDLLLVICCKRTTLKVVSLLGVPRQLTEFPNLEDVEVILRGDIDLENLTNGSWPLSRLCLIHSSMVPIGIRALLEGVEHFKDTLKTLRIDYQDYCRLEDCDFRADLPHLTKLELEGIPSVDYFVNLSKLEELRITDWKPVGEPRPDQAVKTVGIEKDMLKSNIWALFPKLRKLHTSCVSFSSNGFQRTYSRDEYETFCKQQNN